MVRKAWEVTPERKAADDLRTRESRWAGEKARSIDALVEATTTGSPGGLKDYLTAHHDRLLAAWFKPNWGVIAEKLNDMGFRGRLGRDITPGVARHTWWIVRKNLASARKNAPRRRPLHQPGGESVEGGERPRRDETEPTTASSPASGFEEALARQRHPRGQLPKQVQTTTGDKQDE